MEPIIEIQNLSKTFGSGDNHVAALQMLPGWLLSCVYVLGNVKKYSYTAH